jgi:hypothetical protein
MTRKIGTPMRLCASVVLASALSALTPTTASAFPNVGPLLITAPAGNAVTPCVEYGPSWLNEGADCLTYGDPSDGGVVGVSAVVMSSEDMTDPSQPWSVHLTIEGVPDGYWVKAWDCGLATNDYTLLSQPTFTVYPQYYIDPYDPENCHIRSGPEGSTEYTYWTRFKIALPDWVRDQCPLWRNNYSQSSEQFHEVRYVSGAVVEGTDGRDDICAYADEVEVSAFGGDDTIYFPPSVTSATVSLGDGANSAYFYSAGTLTVFGGQESDRVSQWTPQDSGLVSSPVSASMASQSSAVFAKGGNDVLDVDQAGGRALGGRGNDVIKVTKAHAEAIGGPGRDRITATLRTAVVRAGLGYDVCRVFMGILKYGILRGCEKVVYL